MGFTCGTDPAILPFVIWCFNCALQSGWVSVNVPVGSFGWGEYRGHRRLMWQQQGVVLPLYTNDIIINSLILNHILGHLQEGSSVLQPLVFPYLRAMCQFCYSLRFYSMRLSFEPSCARRSPDSVCSTWFISSSVSDRYWCDTRINAVDWWN